MRCAFLAAALWTGLLPPHAGEPRPQPSDQDPARPVSPSRLPRVRVAPDGRSFQTDDGQPFTPWGVSYFRPGTGWAPQVWMKFDPEATAADFRKLKDLGANVVRVFLSYGSFLTRPGTIDATGLEKLDRFLDLADEAGLYVHPTGPDHWEGTPEWAQADPYADPVVLDAQVAFWSALAARYRGRSTIFAYDLLNEPCVGWDTPATRPRWARWLQATYKTPEALAEAWHESAAPIPFEQVAAPVPGVSPPRAVLDYQRFREDLADTWTRRQAEAIKQADPGALVTVGAIQWSVPALLPTLRVNSAFRPDRQVRLLDFLEVHFYPLEDGFYEYTGAESEARNLAYLESVVREVARPGKPVVLAEFGWYGGIAPTFDGGRHRPANEADQERWCRRAVEVSRPYVTGWLNWGVYDHPEAGDASQGSGLFTTDGRRKAWGETFHQLAIGPTPALLPIAAWPDRPPLDWDACLTDRDQAQSFRAQYLEGFLRDRDAGKP